MQCTWTITTCLRLGSFIAIQQIIDSLEAGLVHVCARPESVQGFHLNLGEADDSCQSRPGFQPSLAYPRKRCRLVKEGLEEVTHDAC